MFGGAGMARGNLPPGERADLLSTLMAFSDAVRDACPSVGLVPGQVPFARPVNFVAFLNANELHIVVDDVPVGGVPDHTYVDRRQESIQPSLDAAVGAAVRELGFRQPLGVTLPIATNTDNEAKRTKLLAPIAAGICQQMVQRTLVQRLKLPAGYEHFARFMPGFLQDHPDADKNVFLLMRFRNGTQYDVIHQAIRDGLARYGFTVLRADDKDYTGDLWENVCLYMLGSRFAVAVFEEIDLREFNPNVALELGFMLAHNKRCLLLKDQRMPRMPTDVVGKLYKEFDTYNIQPSITKAIEAWARDLGI